MNFTEDDMKKKAKKKTAVTAAGGYCGFKVKGRFIYDSSGGEFIMRGVNKMAVWLDPARTPSG